MLSFLLDLRLNGSVVIFKDVRKEKSLENVRYDIVGKSCVGMENTAD
jgi:hypothetical protein